MSPKLARVSDAKAQPAPRDNIRLTPGEVEALERRADRDIKAGRVYRPGSLAKLKREIERRRALQPA